MAVPAFADPSQTGSFPTVTAGAAAFGPNRLAVDEATGDVYVIDSGSQLVERYSASGTNLGELVGATTPGGTFQFGGQDDDIAVDNSGGPNQGNVYVVGEHSGGAGLVTAYDATGRFLWQYAPVNDYGPGVTDTCGVAVDSSGNLWTADYYQGIQQRSVADGSPIGSVVNRTGDSCQIAFDTTGAFYLTHWQASLSKYTPTITGTPTTIDSGTNRDVATDSVYNDVYTSQGSAIDAYDSSGTALSGAPFGTGLLGVTVDGAHGTIFASNPGAKTVEIWSRGKGSPEPYARLADASSVTATGATLNASVNPASAATTCTFDYGTTTSYGSSAPCASNPGSGTSDVAVSADVTGLSAGTTYYYRVVATNGAGTVNSSTGTFATTLPPQHTLTVVVNGTGNGRVDADSGAIANCTRSGGTCSDHYTEGTPVRLRATPTNSTITWSGDGCSGTSTSCDVTMDADKTVTVTFDQNPPSVATETASGITRTAATLGGTVNPNGAATTCQIEWGATASYGTTRAASPNPGAGTSAVAVSIPALSGLTPNTTYHFRVDCTNAGGTTNGADQTFTTAAIPAPTVVTGGASGVDQTVATIAGTVNPNGDAASCHFDYGTTTAYGSVAPCASSPGSGSSAVGVSAALSGLAAGTTYHYRLVASNGGGSGTGSDATFTTTSPPPPVCPQDLSKCPAPRLQFAGFTSRTLLLKLTCQGYAGQAACSGKLTFKAVIKVRVKHGKKTKLVKKTITVGTASYSIAASGSKSVRLVLTATAKSQLKKGGLTARASGLNATIKLPKTKAKPRKAKRRH